MGNGHLIPETKCPNKGQGGGSCSGRAEPTHRFALSSRNRAGLSRNYWSENILHKTASLKGYKALQKRQSSTMARFPARYLIPCSSRNSLSCCYRSLLSVYLPPAKLVLKCRGKKSIKTTEMLQETFKIKQIYLG